MRNNITIIIHRFLELFISNLIISSFITILYLIGVLGTRAGVCLALIAGTVVFFFLNVKMLRYYFYDLKKNTRLYYILNITAYLIFAFISFIIYVLGPSELYTWLFAITKLIKFTANGVATHYSALFFHSIGLALIFLIPLGNRWAHIDDSNR